MRMDENNEITADVAREMSKNVRERLVPTIFNDVLCIISGAATLGLNRVEYTFSDNVDKMNDVKKRAVKYIKERGFTARLVVSNMNDKIIITW